MDNLQVFSNSEFGKVQVLTLNDESWFLGNEITNILLYTNPSKALKDHVDFGNKKTLKYKASNDSFKALWNGNDYSDKTLINESGLYELILSSKQSSAKKFKRWVTKEVLPTIRKHGAYFTDVKAQEVVNGNGLADLLIQAGEQIKRLEMDRETMLPKVQYFDDLVDRNLLTNFRDTAKLLKIKERQFIKWLEENHYVYRDQKHALKPYAQYNKVLFEMKEQKTNHWEGTQTLITPKGRETFHLLLGGIAHD